MSIISNMEYQIGRLLIRYYQGHQKLKHCLGFANHGGGTLASNYACSTSSNAIPSGRIFLKVSDVGKTLFDLYIRQRDSHRQEINHNSTLPGREQGHQKRREINPTSLSGGLDLEHLPLNLDMKQRLTAAWDPSSLQLREGDFLVRGRSIGVYAGLAPSSRYGRTLYRTRVLLSLVGPRSRMKSALFIRNESHEWNPKPWK